MARQSWGKEAFMCPACIATGVWLVAGAASAGGAAALLVKKLRKKNGAGEKEKAS
jgi:hypothetical protein